MATSDNGKHSCFRKFFIDELKDILWAEQHLAEALPKLADASTSRQLKAAFEKHTRETEQQIETLEKVFELLEERPQAKKCEAMAGLIREANDIISQTDTDTYTRDAGLILTGQKVEHYEIATYGTLRIFALHMDEEKVAKLLTEILDNEKATDVALTKVAENHRVNAMAVAE